MNCPLGLRQGFGDLSLADRRSLCFVLAHFGWNSIGRPIIRPGTGLLFENTPRRAWVITAGHMLYHHEFRRYAQNLSLYFGRYGDRYFHPVNLKANQNQNIFVPDDFRRNIDPIPDLDFGVIRVAGVPNDMTSTPLKHLTDTSKRKYFLVGYPDEGRCRGKRIPFNTVITPNHPAIHNIGYENQQTYKGMSGGPLLALDRQVGTDPQLYSFGMHIRGQSDSSGTVIHHERAVRFNASNFSIISNWL